MAAEEFGLDTGYARKFRQNPIELVIVGVLAIAVIATVVLSIVVLVKVNDASSSTVEQATTTPGQNGNNIPTMPPIASNSPQYNAYLRAANDLNIAINTSADPCNDFYGYACGNYPKNDRFSFVIVDYSNFAIMANQMMDPQYQQPSTPLPLQQTIWFFNKCVDAQNDFGAITQGGTIVINALKAFQDATGLPFPMLNQKTQQTTWPSPATLATALGYLSGVSGVDTLMTPIVDTNWVAPQSATPYFLYVDQNTLSFSKTSYKPGTWQLFQANFVQGIQSILTKLATLTGATLDQAVLMNDTMDIINLELALARNFTTDDTTRRQYMRSYNPTTTAQAQSTYSFINWTVYFKQVFARASPMVQGIVSSPSFTFSVMETDMISRLSQSLVDNNAYGITPRQLVNYLMYRLVASKAGFLPSAKRSLYRQKLYRHPARYPPFIRDPEPIDPEVFENKNLTKAQITCTGDTVIYLQYANARFFVDAIYPDKGVNIRKTAGKIISSILSGFQSMIDQLLWMDAPSKVSAYAKITNLVQNIAFPDFILNDTQLIAYFSALKITQADTYVQMLSKISDFNAFIGWEYLARTNGSDRYDFDGQPGTANAWYQPELNSITFPAGVLQAPFFDQQYPASINYGGLGGVAGHELTHGFDDQGVQWDGVGKLASWMTNSSKQGFQRLANCVINQYDGFCPLPTNYKPNCINGAQTQGENIADNGGIHAAWRAYKTYQALNGPDPRLPDPVLGQFTHDQLFFLAFARVWCDHRSDDSTFSQLLTDEHSPPPYRVLGTIQNYPAFQTAYNCPAGSKYAPGAGKYCNVWVLDNN